MLSPGAFLDLAGRNRRAAVLALAACLRLRLPRLEQVDPDNRAILEAIEAWGRGEAPDSALAETRGRARHVRGAHELCSLIDLASVDLAEVDKKADELVLTVAINVWTQTAAGQAWSLDPRNRATPFLTDPFASKAVLACKGDLWALACRTASQRERPSRETIGRGTFIETAGQDLALWMIRTEADVRPHDILVVRSREHTITAVEVLRSPFDPPPPRTVGLRLRDAAEPPASGAEVELVRGP